MLVLIWYLVALPVGVMAGWRWSDYEWFRLSRSTLQSYFRWPDLNLGMLRMSQLFNFSVVDSVVWAFVVLFESLALVAMLCFFYIFCGCAL